MWQFLMDLSVNKTLKIQEDRRKRAEGISNQNEIFVKMSMKWNNICHQ